MSGKALAIAGIAAFSSLVLINQFGHTLQPFDEYEVRFCPITANTPERYGFEKWDQSQEKLNRNFCNKLVFVNKEVWDKNARYKLLPDGVKLKYIPSTSSNEKHLLWLVPLTCLIGYSALWANLQISIDKKGITIEKLKTQIKERNVDFHVSNVVADVEEELQIDIKTNRMRQGQHFAKDKKGLVNHHEIETEVKMHDARIEMTLAEMEKRTMESLRDKAKAETEKKKHENATSDNPVKDYKKDLLEELKQHENGWLLDILEGQTPIWITGNRQGCGKTWTAISMGLVRLHCLYQPIESVMDRHYNSVNFEVWELLKAKLKATNDQEIAKVMASHPKQWKERMDAKPNDFIQVIVDEYTHLKNDLGEIAENWFDKSLTDTRKAHVNVIGVTHNTTNKTFSEGSKESRTGGMILLQKFSANGKVPLSRASLVSGYFDQQGNELSDHEVTMPNWFQPQIVYDWLVNGIVPKELQGKY